MAGVADAFDGTKTMWEAGKVYVGAAVPAAGAAPTIVTLADGSLALDAVTNPSAVHVGYTEKGTVCKYNWTKKDATDNEHTAPHATKIVAEEMTIEGAWKNLLDPALVETMSVGGTKATVTGGSIVEFGGKPTPTATCIVVVAPRRDDPTKAMVFMIYSGYNTEGVTFTNDLENEASSPFKFVGLSVASRARGKQMGQIFIQS